MKHLESEAYFAFRDLKEGHPEWRVGEWKKWKFNVIGDARSLTKAA
jgi:hypothetical protein